MSDPYRDIIATWPKKKPLEDYLGELLLASMRGDVINYRVARLPHWDDEIEDHGFTSWAHGVRTPRCFMVHDGFVRGWCQILGTCHRGEGEVEGWPAGLYIVRDPVWHPVPGSWREDGFRGWRWVPTSVADRWLTSVR